MVAEFSLLDGTLADYTKASKAKHQFVAHTAVHSTRVIYNNYITVFQNTAIILVF